MLTHEEEAKLIMAMLKGDEYTAQLYKDLEELREDMNMPELTAADIIDGRGY
jgi:hypothetical protein